MINYIGGYFIGLDARVVLPGEISRWLPLISGGDSPQS